MKKKKKMVTSSNKLSLLAVNIHTTSLQFCHFFIFVFTYIHIEQSPIQWNLAIWSCDTSLKNSIELPLSYQRI